MFAIVILSGEVPSGLLSDLWGRKKTLLLGSTLKAVSFSILPLWSSYEGFLVWARCCSRGALNERISSAFRATMISMAQLGLPSVLSALGILFSIAFVGLLLPLALCETALTTKEAST